MPSLSVHAYGFAAVFKLRELISVFMDGADEARVDKDRLLAVFRPSPIGATPALSTGLEETGGGWALAYDFGAVVFVGVDAERRSQLISRLTARLPDEPHPPLTENFLIDVIPSGAMEVRFDRVVVPEVTLPIVEIIAEVLAQSVAMDYYAKDVEEIETGTDRIVLQLQAGRVPGRVPDLVRFIGLCIATRNDIISTLALFDKPEETWENEQLDRLWNGLHNLLELNDRYRTLEAKLRMFQDNLEVLVDLSRQRDTIRLEFSVVILILLEIFVMIWQALALKPR